MAKHKWYKCSWSCFWEHQNGLYELDAFLNLFPKTTETQIICPSSLGKNRGGILSKMSGYISMYPLGIP